MNILLDFIPFQQNGGIGGAASFAKAVYDRISEKKSRDVKLFAAFNATLPSGMLYDYKMMANSYQAELVDLSRITLADIINDKHIEVFFIAIGQFYENYDLNGISCKTVMFIHDIFEYERNDNKLDLIIYDKEKKDRWDWIKRCMNLTTGRWEKQLHKRYDGVMHLYEAPNTIAYTVSNYSKNALQYYFPHIKKDIHICYSPLRTTPVADIIENEELKKLISSGKKFLLMLAANRRYKNAHTMVKVFSTLTITHPDLYLLTLKYGKSIHPHHIDIQFLSDSDLEHAYKHAYALVFGSFFEGFGYPPIEAMKYGTPTAASNVTSIPEILGDAGVYFSPFYPADLYRVLKQILQNHDIRKEAIIQRYQQIIKRQENDLDHLINNILSGT